MESASCIGIPFLYPLPFRYCRIPTTLTCDSTSLILHLAETNGTISVLLISPTLMVWSGPISIYELQDIARILRIRLREMPSRSNSMRSTRLVSLVISQGNLLDLGSKCFNFALASDTSNTNGACWQRRLVGVKLLLIPPGVFS